MKPTNEQEQLIEKEFNSEWEMEATKWSFPLGSHHKRLVEEAALRLYKAGRLKSMEEIEKLKWQRSLTIKANDNQILMIEKLESSLQDKEQEIDKAKSFFEDGWKEKIDELSIEDLRLRVILMHSWVKLHQYQVEKANVDKNFYKSQLQEKEQEIERFTRLIMGKDTAIAMYAADEERLESKLPDQEELRKALDNLESVSGAFGYMYQTEEYLKIKTLLEKLHE